MARKPKPISCADAGRRGGDTTLAKYGRGHYKKIGKVASKRRIELIAKGRAIESILARDDADLEPED